MHDIFQILDLADSIHLFIEVMAKNFFKIGLYS